MKMVWKEKKCQSATKGLSHVTAIGRLKLYGELTHVKIPTASCIQNIILNPAKIRGGYPRF